VLSDPAHRETACLAAERAAVLLQNEGGVLPLDRSAMGLNAVIGPMADDRPATLGPWVVAPDLGGTVTVLDGLRRAAGDRVRVEHAPGETRTLRFTIPAVARRYWSAADRAYVIDESDFDVWVGGDSTAELHAEFAVRAGAG
jgi:hypothetical protein